MTPQQEFPKQFSNECAKGFKSYFRRNFQRNSRRILQKIQETKFGNFQNDS